PARNINGVVLEVGLIAVKVQNFDNTIVTVPPYSLLSESFQNWRGMTDSGGRRINRSVTIDINSIAFMTEESVAALREEPWWTDTLDETPHHVNLTVFRRYLEHYLDTLPERNKAPQMTCMVRELAPTPQGVPVDIYFFTDTTAWIAYEGIQAKVMDHIFASVGRFGLRIYQAPSGLDLASAAGSLGR
ncbi:MAG: mechanosensitive ion channel family protein, partial [Duncaniella sp.]|nr:mechanosensitive ion channel family protein [Duncaniella sp.]